MFNVEYNLFKRKKKYYFACNERRRKKSANNWRVVWSLSNQLSCATKQNLTSSGALVPCDDHVAFSFVVKKIMSIGTLNGISWDFGLPVDKVTRYSEVITYIRTCNKHFSNINCGILQNIFVILWHRQTARPSTILYRAWTHSQPVQQRRILQKGWVIGIKDFFIQPRYGWLYGLLLMRLGYIILLAFYAMVFECEFIVHIRTHTTLLAHSHTFDIYVQWQAGMQRHYFIQSHT